MESVLGFEFEFSKFYLENKKKKKKKKKKSKNKKQETRNKKEEKEEEEEEEKKRTMVKVHVKQSDVVICVLDFLKHAGLVETMRCLEWRRGLQWTAMERIWTSYGNSSWTGCGLMLKILLR